jgi:hypothetical protein
MTFAVVSALGIVLQVDAAGVGPDQKADALPSDPATLATIKAAIALARKGELAQASDVEESIGDPVARKVVDWAILRSKEVDFQRYVAFIFENPNWPNIGLLRRRAEAALWKERLDPQIVAGILARTSRSPPRASLRLLARCCWKATAPTRRISFARVGVTTTSPATSKSRFWMFSEG